MDRIAVKSSNIKSIGWEDEVLQVEFLPHKEGEPGRAYEYVGVPYEKYRAFLNAESVGSHFATFIRANYEGHRIDSGKDVPKKEERHGEERKEEGKKAKRIS
jgi:hypothetical protein